MWTVDLGRKEIDKFCPFMTYKTDSFEINIKVWLNSVPYLKKFSKDVKYDEKMSSSKHENELRISFNGNDKLINISREIVKNINHIKILKIRENYTVDNPYDDDNIYPPDRLCVVPFTVVSNQEYDITLELKNHPYIIKLFEELGERFDKLHDPEFIKGCDEIKNRI